MNDLEAEWVSLRISLAVTVLRLRMSKRDIHELDRAVIQGVVSLLQAVENDADLAPLITSSALELATTIGVEP